MSQTVAGANQAVTSDATNTGDAHVIVLNLEDIYVEPKNNARKTYSDEHIEGLAASIESMGGLLQAVGIVAVNPGPKNDGKSWELVYGFCRVMALRLLGGDWENNVKCGIMLPKDSGELKAAQMIENLHRSNLNPIETAAGIAEIMKAEGLNQKQVGALVGVKEVTLSRLLSLLRLPPECQKMVADEVISLSHAREIVRFAPKDDMDKYRELCETAKDMTYGEFESHLQNLYGGNASAEESAEGDVTAKKSTDAAPKRPQLRTAKDLQENFLTFLSNKAKSADGEEKKYTAKQLREAQVDVLNCVMRVPETKLEAAIAPFLAAKAEKDAADKAKKDSGKNKEKFFSDSVKTVNANLKSPLGPDGNRPFPEYTSAAKPVVDAMAIASEENLKDIGFEFDGETFEVDLRKAWETDYKEKRATAEKKAKDKASKLAKEKADKEAAELGEAASDADAEADAVS